MLCIQFLSKKFVSFCKNIVSGEKLGRIQKYTAVALPCICGLSKPV